MSVGEGNYFGLPNFTLCVTAPPACADPTGLAVGNLTAGGASVGFTPAAGISSYLVTYQAVGGPVQTVSPPPATSPVQLTGLGSGVRYTVTVQSVCAAGLGTPLTATFTAPLDNDECATATPIASIGVNTCGTPVPGTNVLASASAGIPAPGCANYTGGDVWYSLVVPANGILQVETGPVAGSALTNTGLALYGGPCGNLTLLGCNDDIGGGNSFSRVRLTALVPGSTVYVRVWNPFNGFSGPFTICAQTDVACPPVTNLALGNLTASGAQVSFTGPANATSYTVTYGQGGTTTVLTAIGSPVQLSGLQPSVAYTVCVTHNCVGGAAVPVCVNFTTPVPCPAVTGLSIGNQAGTTATLNFTGPAAATGGYLVTVTPQGGSPTTVVAPAAPVALTGLTVGAAYTVSVVSNCGGGLASAPATLTFLNATYCATGLQLNTCGTSVITNVTIPTTTLNNTSTCGPGTGTVPYVSYPATGNTTATLVPGQTYQFVVTSNSTSDLTAWIDYDHDGVFSVSEGTQVGLAAGGNLPATASFTVPPVAPLGLTGMRVRARGAGAGNGPANACTPFASGETEDYLISLAPAALPCLPPTAVAATALTATSASVGFTMPSGSAPATAYTATALPTGGTVPVTATGPTAPLTLAGLAPNTAYSLTVTATCGGGASGPSAPPVAFRTLLASRSAALAAAVGLFPNPAHAGATLTLPAGLNPTGGTVALLDALGRTVGRWPLAPGSTRLEVPLAGRAAGVYALRLRLGDDTAVKRLVVE